jgi:hypothetical protein
MTTEATQTVSSEAIAAETERLLAVAAERNNLSVDVVREQYNAVAREQAMKNLEEEAKRGTSYQSLYEQERKRAELAESTLAAIREQGVKHGGGNTGGAPVSAEQARRRAGDMAWLHRMTPEQKIAALGIPPESVDQKEAAKIFRRGADPALGTALHKADPQKYRILREVSKAIGSYGA